MNNVFVQQSPAAPSGPSAFNAQYARALSLGDPRYQIKTQRLDRPGISRGRAQMNMAGIGAAQDVIGGISDAYSQEIQRASGSAGNRLQDAADTESYAQSLGALQQQNAYANQLAALQRRDSILSGLLR